MTQKIGLISDVHATPSPVKEALSIFRKQGVDRIFCAGDFAGYGEGLGRSIELLDESGCQSISGNHDIWYLERQAGDKETGSDRFLSNLSRVLKLTIEGIKLYFVHASPPQSMMKGIHLLDETGHVMLDQKKFWDDYLKDFEFDVLVVGHTHQVFAEKLGNTLVINPGSTKFNHTCAILSLPDMNCRVVPLSGKTPLSVWNWGIFRTNG
ncbi:MAG: metallophosphoesterase family protein [Desulfobacteraceae bacterium]|nr:metallophosphoesterase family protein [Desulfobacteraceae bacterium]MBC2754697.1 metallophosphoesterase family protein [Desulfobacteraceae bacterium]